MNSRNINSTSTTTLPQHIIMALNYANVREVNNHSLHNATLLILSNVMKITCSLYLADHCGWRKYCATLELS